MTTPQPAALPELTQLTGDIQIQDRTIYVLNKNGENAWWATVYPGFHDNGIRVSDDQCRAVAADLVRLAALQSQPAAFAPTVHIKEPYTLAELNARIASNDYNAELLLQHAMLLLNAQPAEVSDAAVWELWLRVCAESDNLSTRVMIANFARAILALRPQSESEARRAAQEQLYTERERHTAEVKRLQAEIGRLQSERPQAVPMTKASRDTIMAALKTDGDADEWPEPWAYRRGWEGAEAHHGITAQGAQGGEGRHGSA